MIAEDNTEIQSDVLGYDEMQMYPLHLKRMVTEEIKGILIEDKYKPIEVRTWRDPKKAATVVQVIGQRFVRF